MVINVKSVLLVVLSIIFLIILFINNALSCAPYLPKVVFVPNTHPDMPPFAFIKGDIGVIQPGYNYLYLTIAYLHIKGSGLSTEQTNSIINAFKIKEKCEANREKWEQANNESIDQGKGPLDNSPYAEDPACARTERAYEKWYYERAKVKKVLVPDEPITNRANIIYSDNNNEPFCYVEYFETGCNVDAYRTAAETLNRRIKQFGVDSLEVIEWVKGQDIVFFNCNSGAAIPPDAPPKVHSLIKADRSYQIAASCLYAHKFDEAEKRFRQISVDDSSPWKTISAYLVGRTMVNKAYAKSLCHPDRQILQQASDHLEQIMRNKELDTVHQYAWELLRFIKIQINPVQAFAELAGSIEHKNSKHDFNDDLYEYDFLLRNRTALIENSNAIDAMTDWLLTIKNKGKDNFLHAVLKWKETSAPEWLIAALMNAQGSDPDTSSLLKAAQNIAVQSPAYLLAQFHILRLMIESGEYQQSRIRLDEIIAQYGKRIPASSLNQFLSLRMKVSDSIEEFLTYAQRFPILLYDAYDDSEDYKEDIKKMLNTKRNSYWDIFYSTLKLFADGHKLLDKDSVIVMNELLPLDILTKAAQSNALPDYIKKELVPVVWARAVVLNRYDSADKLISAMKKLIPDMATYANRYAHAKDNKEKEFISALIIAKYPGMKPYMRFGIGRLTRYNRIDNLYENWWFPMTVGIDLDKFIWDSGYWHESPALILEESIRKFTPVFLTEQQIEQARQERKSLSAVETAPDYFGKIILNWAKEHRNDPLVPEALHYVVRATRYGATSNKLCYEKNCTELEKNQTARYSQEAFQLIHSRYRKSPWTKKTPFWFDE